MKKYYITTGIAILLLICLQVGYIYNLYREYSNQCKIEIENVIYSAIDKERNTRYLIKKKASNPSRQTFAFEPLDEMNPKKRDSLLKLYPLPPKPVQYDVEQLRRKGIIRNAYDIMAQKEQDDLSISGYPLNISVLDSLFSKSVKATYPHVFMLYDKSGKLLSASKPLVKEYAYKTAPFIIGIESRQQLTACYDIPLSSFVVRSIGSLIASLIIIGIAILSLVVQITIIRRKQQRLEYIDQNINATIHDLKSPLSGVVMTLDFAKQKIESGNMKSVIELSKANVKHLIGTIDSLLMVARQSNGEIVLRRQCLDKKMLSDMIDTMISDFDNLYGNKPHRFDIHIDLPDDCSLSADPLYLESILRNLLDNALKYSDDDVLIKLMLEQSEKYINFTIADNGWGVPEKYRKKLFKAYFRVPRPNDNQRGYGVGLTQVKYLVERHGGMIRMESREGVGTTFHILLPYESDC